MRRRMRKLIGAVAMVGIVVVYTPLAAAFALSRPMAEAPVLLQMVIYAVLGLAWILPLLPLIKWMERPDHDEA